MRVKVAGRCLWTAMTEIIRFVPQIRNYKSLYTEIFSSHCEHTKTLIRDLFSLTGLVNDLCNLERISS